MDIDWNLLRARAYEVMGNAYAPYSRFPVGAAGLTHSRLVTGCNVENVSYGLALCAECVLIGNLISAGGGRRLRAISVTDSRGEILMPCGRCRQLLHEHGGADLLVDHKAGPVPLRTLLPEAFGPADLDAGRG